MFQMYLRIALRKLAKERVYVAVNILSLAIGIGSFLILSLYLRSELSYDQHFSNHENIYRISTHFGETSGSPAHFAITQEGIGPMLVQDYPQLGETARFRTASQNVLSYGDLRYTWDDIYLVDENVFNVFDHEILAGDPATAFANPNAIAISETFATAYFGEEDALGKTLSTDSYDYQVTLVFADLPENTHLKYSALYPYSMLRNFVPNYEENYVNGLTSVSIFTYLHVPETFDVASFPGIVEQFVTQYMTERLSAMNSTFSARLTRLDAVHFSESLAGDAPSGNVFYIYGFAAVAVFILLVACINYMNLATARATKRAREVGMRKVLGATRSQLITQFMGESAVFTVIALVLGVAAAFLALAVTPMGDLMGKEELLSGLMEPAMIAGILGTGVLVALLAGLYPAFYLSAISPKAALSKVRDSGRSGLSVRQVLVLTQMAISIGVIACTLAMSQQMQFIASKPLGFNQENKVWLSLRGADVIENIPTIANELLTHSDILDVLETGNVPGFGNGINMIPIESNEGVIGPQQVDRIVVGLNYVDALNIEVMSGRSFSDQVTTDAQRAAMVNEAMVRKMGWDQPLGKRIGGNENPWLVVGVVSDFHYAPLHNEIGPLVIMPMITNFANVPAAQRPLQSRNLIVNISGDNIPQTLATIEQTVRQFDPDLIFDPTFMDARLDDLYRSETNLMNLTEVFAGICILISAMGLFGLAAFTTEQRSREIGVRKVLGATSVQIVTLLSRHLLVLLVVAAVPATVISYLTIQSWLGRFAYRAEPDMLGAAMPFVIAIAVVFLIAFFTVAAQSWKAAQSDPVKTLRHD